MGLEAVVAPLFRIVPLPWQAPGPVEFDAVLITSANAAREAGPQMTRLLDLPCFAVGEETGRACRAAGFADVRTGPADGAALADTAAEAGVERALHLCGREHVAFGHAGLSVVRHIVYGAEPVERLPGPAAQALRDGAVTLIHSRRAGALFSGLFDAEGLERATASIATISNGAAAAVGGGWKRVVSADRPRDNALLELAAQLCKTGASDTRKKCG